MVKSLKASSAACFNEGLKFQGEHKFDKCSSIFFKLIIFFLLSYILFSLFEKNFHLLVPIFFKFMYDKKVSSSIHKKYKFYATISIIALKNFNMILM